MHSRSEIKRLAVQAPEKLVEEIERLRAENKLIGERASAEARLACDLRARQDEIIERCAQAIAVRWPEAASALRMHDEPCSGEDYHGMRRERDQLRAELAKARDLFKELADEARFGQRNVITAAADEALRSIEESGVLK